MTIPSSGPVTFTDIQTEFGGTNPIALNEYYAGGGLVPAGTTGTYGPVPSSGQISVQNFYGTTAFTPVYIEEVFQTWLYTGNAGTQTVTNGIDLSGKGGMVWTKSRSNAYNPSIMDTVRGFNYSGTQIKRLDPTNTDGQASSAGNATQASPLSNGFSITTSGGGAINFYNASGATYTSWTFREQPKFFDIVTFTAGSSTNRRISHSLDSIPGFWIMKALEPDGPNWPCYHTSLGLNAEINLNLTNASASGSNRWGTAPTSTTLGINEQNMCNAGYQYVLYIFANNAGGFGATGSDNVITCGSFTADGYNATVSLGYEPQWLMFKRSSGAGDWKMRDNMRGFFVTPSTSSKGLEANTTDAESNEGDMRLTNTGFSTEGSGGLAFDATYIYIAIRRGPMKVPTSGTSVFKPFYASYSEGAAITTDFPLDLSMWKANTTYNWSWQDRLRGWPTASGSGGPALASNTTGVETTAYQNVGAAKFDSNTGAVVSYQADSGRSNEAAYFMFRRAPSFFDEVCYTGTGSATTFSHNLGVVPELMIVKSRSNANDWVVYSASLGATKFGYLNYSDPFYTGSSVWNNTSPTSSVFTVNTFSGVNGSGLTYVAYLFATCAGVSKVGSYTGNGSTQTINCGFTGGSRFVMIKQTSGSGGDWIVFSTAMGIVAGTDRTALFNSGNATTTFGDTLDANNVGFELGPNSALFSINTSSETYIFLAIA